MGCVAEIRRALAVLRVTIILGMLAGFVLSPRLWLGPRFYPVTPVAGFFNPYDRLTFVALVIALLVVAFVPRREVFAAAFALLALVALQDQSRWQPWLYQYGLMLLAVWLGDDERARSTCWLIIAFTYLWSGLAKLNPNFAANAWATFTPHWLRPLWLAAPIVETATGAALLTLRWRKMGTVAAIAMHVFILAAIGPFGQRFNAVVWPWNLVMIALLLLLYSREPIWGKPFLYQKFVFVVLGLLPVLSFFNLWDHYLSSALYSGNRTSGTIYFNDAVFERLPEPVQDSVTDEGPDRGGLELNDWSYADLKVPSYPETRIYRNVVRAICGYGGQDPSIELVVQEQWALQRGGRRLVYGCSGRGAAPDR